MCVCVWVHICMYLIILAAQIFLLLYSKYIPLQYFFIINLLKIIHIIKYNTKHNNRFYMQYKRDIGNIILLLTLNINTP